MEQIYDVVCGMDVHKDSIVACVLAGTQGETVSAIERFGTDYEELDALAQWLQAQECPRVAMESTGAYWTPIYNVLTEAGIECYVVNAQHVKNVPGRKTDMNDAQWIASLMRCGLLKASVVPGPEMQTLRGFTRSYVSLTQDRAREVNRIEKLLQTHGFKLSSVLSDILCATGREILEYLAEHGNVSLAAVKRCRDGRCKHTAEQIYQAMRGPLRERDCWLLKFKLDQIDAYDVQLEKLNDQIREMVEPASEDVQLLTSIPGVGEKAAFQILAEIGADLSMFDSGSQLAAWAGLTPGNNESAGKKSLPASVTATNI